MCVTLIQPSSLCCLRYINYPASYVSPASSVFPASSVSPAFSYATYPSISHQPSIMNCTRIIPLLGVSLDSLGPTLYLLAVENENIS